MYQISNNTHLYTERLHPAMTTIMQSDLAVTDQYAQGCAPMPLVDGMLTAEKFAEECVTFIRAPSEDCDYANKILINTAHPMYQAWQARGTSESIAIANDICAGDWRSACMDWLARFRLRKLNRLADQQPKDSSDA